MMTKRTAFNGEGKMNGLNMRNSKMKILMYCAVACGLLLVFYLLSSTHSHLKDVKGAYDICQQQKDSLLAQLQVVYEQKNRVEKFLQQEKLEHRKSKEDNQLNKQSQGQLEKEKSDLESKLTNLQQEQQTLQSELSQLKEKISQTEDELNKQQAEREKAIQVKEDENTRLRDEVSSLVLEREKLQQRLDGKQKELDNYKENVHAAQDISKRQQNEVNVPKDNHDDDRHAKENQVAGEGVLPPVGLIGKLSTEKAKQSQASDTKSGGGGGVGAGLNNELTDKEAKPNNVEAVAKPKEDSQKVDPAPVQAGDAQPAVKADAGDSQAANRVQEKGPENSNNDVRKVEGNSLQKQAENQDDQHVAPQPNLDNNAAVPNGAMIGGPQEHPKDGMAAWEGSLKRGPQLKQPPAKPPKTNDHAIQSNHQGDEDENYREEADDDAAEEQDGGDDGVFVAADKGPRDRQFNENDLEDNADGMEHNHAKEEGVVVAPK